MRVANPPSMPASVIRWRSYKKGSYKPRLGKMWWWLAVCGENPGKGWIAHPRLLKNHKCQNVDFFGPISKPTSKKERIKVEVVFLWLNPNLWWPRRGRKRWITWSHIIVARVPYREPLQNQSLGMKISTEFMNFRWEAKVKTPATRHRFPS